MKVKVAACQVLTKPYEVEKNAGIIMEWMEKAATQNIQAVSFPEGALTGYDANKEYLHDNDFKIVEKCEQAIVDKAKEVHIDVIFGSAHKEGDKIYNDLVIAKADGKIAGRYMKTHLAEDWPTPNYSKLPIYNVAGVKSCFIICHDVRYPELVRLPAICGAQICFFSSNENTILRTDKLNAYYCQPCSRAAENDIYVVMANAPEDPENISAKYCSHGNSKIIAPDGNVLIEAGYFDQGLFAAEIDTDISARKFALRAANDDNFLKEYLRQGINMVEDKSGLLEQETESSSDTYCVN